MELLRRSVDELRRTVVVVTHDSRVASYGDRVVLLVDGKVASDTTVTDEDQVLEADALGVVEADFRQERSRAPALLSRRI